MTISTERTPEHEHLNGNSSYVTLPRHKSCWARHRKRYIFAITSLFLICIILAVLHLAYHYYDHKPKGEKPKSPPDPEEPLPPSYTMLHTFKRAAVCSDGVACSVIGRDILVQGGSAVDAAIATCFCNGLINMHSMGLGGGFVMTVYNRKTGKAETLNAKEVAPGKATRDMFVANPKSSTKGPLAIAVPGELKGYWSAHKKYGVLPWKTLIQPSIDMCRKGYNMTKSQWDGLVNHPEVKQDKHMRKAFVDEQTNEFKKAGSTVKPTEELCTTLEQISEKGGDDFYKGEMAKKIADDLKKMGSIITLADLNKYEVVWNKPVALQINSDTLYSVPPPGSGILLGFILNILQGYKFTPKDFKKKSQILTLHRIIEAFKFAYARRTEFGDPKFVDIKSVSTKLASPQYAESIRKSISDDKTINNTAHYGAVFSGKSDRGTAHISVLAENGDAVSITSSINFYFGSGVTSEQTGIVFNNHMDDFSTPGTVNFFGIPSSPANFILPYKRPMSSMCPTIIVDQNGKVKMVIGASGGTKITTAVALVIMRHLWFGQSIKEAVDAPRIHHQLIPMHVDYEYGAISANVKGLKRKGHKLVRYTHRGSIVCALSANETGIYANSDFRKGGDVFGIN